MVGDRKQDLAVRKCTGGEQDRERMREGDEREAGQWDAERKIKRRKKVTMSRIDELTEIRSIGRFFLFTRKARNKGAGQTG